MKKSSALAFDHEAIRRFIGVIALALPLAVRISAWEVPESISGSYHYPTSSFPYLPYFPAPRDIFVGCLFVIGAFLMSYKGRPHKTAGKFWRWLARYFPAARTWGDVWRIRQEDFISSLGGIAAWGVALFPTEKIDPALACPKPLTGLEALPPADAVAKAVSAMHLTFAVILFLTTVYFCLVAFRVRVTDKIERRGAAGAWYQDALKLRLMIYNASGFGILSVILLLGALKLANLFLAEEICLTQKQTYWAEALMLLLFAAAWITASKPFFLKDPQEKTGAPKSLSE